MKTIILFVIGLLSWLLLTNFQVVYSKVASYANTNQESAVVVASTDNNASSPLNDITEVIETSEETSNSGDVKSTLQDVEEPHQSESTTSTTIAELTNNDDLIEISDGKPAITSITTPAPEIEVSVKAPSEEIESNATVANQVPMNHPWMPPNSTTPTFNQNMMNSAMMNPGMFMNPMAMMTPMMMSMMGPMMNPAMMMNPNAMFNHPINTMTHPQNMNAMMMSMNPNMMFSMFGQPSKEYLEGEVPDQLPVITIPGMPTQSFQNWPINKLSPGVSREAKKNAFQTAMALSPLNMRDMMGIMADKIPVEEGVSWDDAVEAMKLRANEVNFKFVGSSPLWKQIEAETEQPSAKVEMFRFCDATVARKILDVVPEFIVFLPCKIALLEDGEGKLWVMTMDWDISWLDFSQNPNSHFSKEIREDAKRIRDNLNYIMEGAATGDF
ncbi:MAG: DUF302 domain-containing protein [Gammaproteobacteria bacterium]